MSDCDQLKLGGFSEDLEDFWKSPQHFQRDMNGIITDSSEPQVFYVIMATLHWQVHYGLWSNCDEGLGRNELSN